MRKYVAFDIETAAEIPGDGSSWKSHRPLGITCAAALRCDFAEPEVWHGRNPDGSPSRCMSFAETRNIVQELVVAAQAGYTVLTWNGLGFDFDILAEESGLHTECRELALNHVDMMFHVVCDRGFPVALDKVAQALRIPGKPPGMSGGVAPSHWAQGRHQDVLNYVAEDVRTTLQIAQMCEQRRRFDWITQRGTAGFMNLASGWLSVIDAAQLPEPDTSWMSSPIPRYEFMKWLDAPQRRHKSRLRSF